jgi:transcriptional regulator with XRE-family HTH domain
MADLTALGDVLERAREALGLSKREAARQAGISEGRWRQVVSGYQRQGDVMVPVNPRRATVVGMARAVGVPEDEALRAAGLEVFANVGDGVGVRDNVTAVLTREPVERLIEDIYGDDRIPEERKHEMVRRIRQAEAERQSVQDELNRWRRTG